MEAGLTCLSWVEGTTRAQPPSSQVSVPGPDRLPALDTLQCCPMACSLLASGPEVTLRHGQTLLPHSCSPPEFGSTFCFLHQAPIRGQESLARITTPGSGHHGHCYSAPAGPVTFARTPAPPAHLRPGSCPPPASPMTGSAVHPLSSTRPAPPRGPQLNTSCVLRPATQAWDPGRFGSLVPLVVGTGKGPR